jgi:HEPN domain-containing protein
MRLQLTSVVSALQYIHARAIRPTIQGSMVNIEKQVGYWRDSANEDWTVAGELVRGGRTRHGLFFAHLALEKTLKAIIARRAQDIPPRLHNLVRLAEIAGVEPTEEQLDTLAVMNTFNLEGRYPAPHIVAPTRDEALIYLARTEELLEWLTLA